MKKDIKLLTLNPFLHRGFFDNKTIPENSIAAIHEAINKKCGVEIDVHKTLDNKIIVFNDYNLLRMCGINKQIESLNYQELNKYVLLNTKYKIPLLKDILKVVNCRIPLLIEIKSKKLDVDFIKLLNVN